MPKLNAMLSIPALILDYDVLEDIRDALDQALAIAKDPNHPSGAKDEDEIGQIAEALVRVEIIMAVIDENNPDMEADRSYEEQDAEVARRLAARG